MTGLDPALEYHVVNSLGWANLRPLQADAVAPVRSGDDCVLVAPTAGGKTEAAVFPLLSEMVAGEWWGTTVLYVTPLRALLNNLYPRISSYAAWLGRTVGLWHGDVGDSERRRILGERPDVLLTTPESLEAMLVSRRVDHWSLFSGVRAIVVDELHSFAAQDRGWHLLGVLERLQRIANRPIQRVGLSATIGNPAEVGAWLQGSSRGRPPVRVVTEEVAAGCAVPDVTLDYVGSVENAARVVASLHQGEKRLVFLESRRKAEQLAFELRQLQVETYVSHSSLSADERRRSEQAFADATDCVIVATSTLELGVDIGSLDRVIQVDAPRTVSSFLQRLGRTGRRPGTTRNMLLLATDDESLLAAAAVLLLWKRGFVEPVMPPPRPRHLAAQQLLALALQEGRFGASSWREWWGDLALMDDGDEVLAHLRAEDFLVEDSGLLMIGPRAEKEFGRRHFMDLLGSFIAELELRVFAGTSVVGYVSPLALSGVGDRDPKPLVLNGLGWHVEAVEWEKFTVWVRAQPVRGDVRWQSSAIVKSFEYCRAERDVVLGTTPDVALSRRVAQRLPEMRGLHATDVDEHGLVLQRGETATRLWTWAGMKANATLLAAADLPPSRLNNAYVLLPPDVTVEQLRAADCERAVPDLPAEELKALKFSLALPQDVARQTVGERFADRVGAARVLDGVFVLPET